MIMASDIFASKIREKSRNFRCKVKVNNEDFECAVKFISITKGMMGDSVKFGTMYVPSLEMELMETSSSLLGKEVSVEVGMLLGQNDDGTKNYEYVKVITCYINEETISDGVIKVKGLGSLAMNMMGLYVSNLDFPNTVGSVINEIATMSGTSVIAAPDMDMAMSIDVKPEGLQYREMLCAIAGAFKANVTEDADGNVVIKNIMSGSEFLYNGEYCLDEPEFGNEYMDEDYSFIPGEFSLALGDPRIEPWDIISFTNRHNKTYRVAPLNIVHTFDGGFATGIVAPGQDEDEAGDEVAGPIAEMIERTHVNMQSVRQLLAGKVDINKANIDEAWIKDLLVSGGIIADSVHAGDGYFSHDLVGVNISGENIIGGTISADRLIIRDKDGNGGLLFALNEIDGTIDYKNMTEEELKRLTLDGKIITAGSITAEQINVDDIFTRDIVATGDFSLGKGGALVYNSETDSIDIRAHSISLGAKTVATQEDVRNKIEGEIEPAMKNMQESIEGQNHSLSNLQGVIELTNEMYSKVKTFFNFDEDGLTIGKAGSDIISVQDNDSYEFRDKSNNKILSLNTKGADAPTVNIEKQATYFDKWAVRKGAANDFGNNLNDVWIGGLL